VPAAYRERPPDACLVGTHKGVTRRHPAACLDDLVFCDNPGSNLAAASRTLPGLGAMREPTNCDMITGARDIPRIIDTPRRHAAAAQERRKKRRPLATTPGTSPSRTG